MIDEYPNATLYILMRQDMTDSLNAGKAMAQAAHAANQFVRDFGNAHTAGYYEWMQQGRGFGTTIVLGVDSEAELRHYLDNAGRLRHPADIVLDETYPVPDGYVTHLIPVFTCGYIFVKDREDNGGALIEGLDLHP